MKITPDTNVLVRALVGDDVRQSKIAQAELSRATVVALALPALCELAWVLSRGYKYRADQIAEAIRLLIADAKVSVDRAAVDAGLAILTRRGDFADGVIAHDGARLGGDLFVSFDRRATTLIEARGRSVRRL